MHCTRWSSESNTHEKHSWSPQSRHGESAHTGLWPQAHTAAYTRPDIKSHMNLSYFLTKTPQILWLPHPYLYSNHTICREILESHLDFRDPLLTFPLILPLTKIAKSAWDETSTVS